MRLIVYFLDGAVLERYVSNRDAAMFQLFELSQERTVLTYKIVGV